ncbi:DNA recombination protein RmuC [Candidatus Peregrinibacteria bacterium]|nr:DNA recombination protein RmuC [Candidatus Peregrinibacteria bacterium]
MEIIYIVLIVGLFFLSGFLGFTYINKSNKRSDISERMDMLSKSMTDNLNNVTKLVLQQLNAVNTRVDERLKENIEVLQRQHRSVGERLDTAAKIVNTVNTRLAKIEEGNKKIYDVGKDISSLQELLKAPKLRGALGELFLDDLLTQILPKNNFDLQYAFKSGEKVDAVVFLRDSLIIPVDAKFPLENFKKMLEENDDTKTAGLRKMFVNDVKKRIDEIASKYILPDEGTLDFALMYVPAENIYYEIIVKDSKSDFNLSSYAFSKKVIPVSPNTFYIYLHTILLGLKGFQIEKKAGEILSSLSSLRTDFEKFGEEYELVGKHLGHARNSYENSEKKLERFTDKLSHVEALSSADEEVKLIS